MPNKPVLFFPSNDTIADWMIPIYERFPNKSDFVIFPTRKENAESFLDKNQIRFHSYYPGIIRELKPSICVFGIDWGLEEIEAILESRLFGIPTVAIQEGVILNLEGNKPIDIADTNYVQDKYLNTDYFFCFGGAYLSSLNRNNIKITGNPKFDKYSKLPLPNNPKILINCNFVYGVAEEGRKRWVQEVVEACENLNVEYFVSKHPRDFGEIDVDESRIVKSSSSTILDQIASSSIIISRASTIIYEAIAAGRKVVYHNPGIEPLSIIESFSSSVLRKSTTKSELVSSIRDALNFQEIEEIDYLEFCHNHLGTIERDSAKLCAISIIDIINNNFNPTASIQVSRKTNSIYDMYLAFAATLIKELENANKLIVELRGWTEDLNQAKAYYLNQIAQLEQDNISLLEEIRRKNIGGWFKKRINRIK